VEAEEVVVMQEAPVVVLETMAVLLALEHKAIPVVVLDTVMMAAPTVLCMVAAVADQMLLLAQVTKMTEREGLVNCSPLLLHMEQTPLMWHQMALTVDTLLVVVVVALETVKHKILVSLEAPDTGAGYYPAALLLRILPLGW
jgi:hypothetical protein